LGKIQNAFRDLIKKNYSISPNTTTPASTDYSSGHVNRINSRPFLSISNGGPPLPVDFVYKKRRRSSSSSSNSGKINE